MRGADSYNESLFTTVKLHRPHQAVRCWLKGSEGDALHAVLCAAGYNIRWLLRAIVRLGLVAVFCACVGW